MITNTDYQKFVRVGDQTWEILEISIGIIFFIFFAWDLYYLFFKREFSSLTWKKKLLPAKALAPTHYLACSKSNSDWNDEICRVQSLY